MEFIANYWYIWLLIMTIGLIYIFINQLTRMKNMTKISNLTDTESSFFKGIAPMIVAGVIFFVTFVLLMIGVVINVIRYFQQ